MQQYSMKTEVDCWQLEQNYEETNEYVVGKEGLEQYSWNERFVYYSIIV